MREFAYRPRGHSRAETGALAGPRTSVIAGGTEMLKWLRLGIANRPPWST